MKQMPSPQGIPTYRINVILLILYGEEHLNKAEGSEGTKRDQAIYISPHQPTRDRL